MSNKLINETSPYLLQHAHNPVNWYPWGEEALQKAKKEDKPIFLSIGYSACHWCHVMERESFENEQVALLMNRYFINIKVDREERPDLDAIYMNAVVALTGQGGWPMSVWLTPEGVPFYGGTYFPPTDRMGLPGFDRLLEMLAQTYAQKKESIETQSQQILNVIENAISLQSKNPLDTATIEQAIQSIARTIDHTNGGTTGAPKFPQPMIYDFLLRAYERRGEDIYLKIVELTLQKMATGGIYDHLGGGFHRYSTDHRWLVPHFEKMLYDNALLARLYLHTYQATGNPKYKQVVTETLDYVIREMTDPSGGFYSTQDADSEGEEGKFFVWTVAEIESLLGQEEAKLFCAAYDMTESGNWEGKSILNLPHSWAKIAGDFSLTEADLAEKIVAAKKKLFAHRETRIKPARDEKILTAWNGMMLAAFAEAARVLDRPDYLAVAEKNANFLLTHLSSNGRLLRTWKGGQAKLMAYLEDYTFLTDGLLALYQTTFDERWFVEARRLTDIVLTHFTDSENGGFFDTANDHETLVTRPKGIQDNAIPSGNAMAIRNLLQLAAYTNNNTYHQAAHNALSGMQSMMAQHPGAFSHWLGALIFALASAKEVAVIGFPDDAGTKALLNVIQKPYHPNQVVALSPVATVESTIPLLNHRPRKENRATAYVCQNFTCRLPVTEPSELETQL